MSVTTTDQPTSSRNARAVHAAARAKVHFKMFTATLFSSVARV
jgi:hypothetical protein